MFLSKIFAVFQCIIILVLLSNSNKQQGNSRIFVLISYLTDLNCWCSFNHTRGSEFHCVLGRAEVNTQTLEFRKWHHVLESFNVFARRSLRAANVYVYVQLCVHTYRVLPSGRNLAIKLDLGCDFSLHNERKQLTFAVLHVLLSGHP